MGKCHICSKVDELLLVQTRMYKNGQSRKLCRACYEQVKRIAKVQIIEEE